MTSRFRCLLLAAATCAVVSGCGADKTPVIGNAKPVKPGAVRGALDATDLQIKYLPVKIPNSSKVSDAVAGEITGSDGAARAFAVWVVARTGSDSTSSDARSEWKPKVKGDPGGSSGCGDVQWAIGHAGDTTDAEEGVEWGRAYNTIKNSVCEVVYGKGVVLPP